MTKSFGFVALVLFLPLGACSCEDTVPPFDGGVIGPDAPATDVGPRFDGGPGFDGGPDAMVGPVCGDLTCGVGERCEMDPARCVPNTCEDLACAPTELCVPAPVGDGNVCEDNSCDDSVDCELEQFCDAGGFCTDDICEPGVTMCDGDTVSACSPDGSGMGESYSCGSDAYFTSACMEDGAGAFCPCTGDWDCPSNTECLAERCVGTGIAPTCVLAPADFSDVLPQAEAGFPWGGTNRANRNAEGSPFPTSSQVVITPLVANLNDDNGDGTINENDTPEIIFMTFCGSSYTNNGTLRAVHGGAPEPGGDFFASCGDNLWNEGDDTDTGNCCNAGVLDPTSTPAVGDINGDGVPEIVAVDENDRLRLFSNTAALLAVGTNTVRGGNHAVSLANVDGLGNAEVVIGRQVHAVFVDDEGVWSFGDVWEGSGSRGNNGQGPISCVADVTGDGRAEIFGGATAYRFPAGPVGADTIADCTGAEVDVDEVAWCSGDLVTMWDGGRDGFCAIADVWGGDSVASPGPANPIDGVPELVLITSGRLQIRDVLTGEVIVDRNLNAGSGGGAPNVDDFDGDGFPEIGTAFASGYLLIDLQDETALCPAWPNRFADDATGLQGNPERTPPAAGCTTDADCGDTTQFACNATGACTCLHNSWSRETEDSSSRVTGSSVFDFNGDGSAEVIYNDECFFRVYAGVDGSVFFKEPSPSRTRTENPVVADVDSDGNAEIVFAASNESGFCSEGNDYNNGIEVWGDASDSWVNARRIYNQHSYHVTNVYEGGGIPAREPESWTEWNGRLYNTYRSQPRSPFGAAPDLQVASVQVSSPDAMCGMLTTTIDITARIVNAGDVLVGAATSIAFFGEWDSPVLDEPLFADGAMTPLATTAGVPLGARGETLVTVRYEASNNSPGVLPDRIRVVVDFEDNERECLEDNNTTTADVDGGALLADLSVELGAVDTRECPNPTLGTTITNLGSADASDVLVVYFAGDPATGVEIHRETRAGPIAAGGGTDTFTATLPDFPSGDVRVNVVVDPDNTIPECNDGNNADAADDVANCLGLI